MQAESSATYSFLPKADVLTHQNLIENIS